MIQSVWLGTSSILDTVNNKGDEAKVRQEHNNQAVQYLEAKHTEADCVKEEQ